MTDTAQPTTFTAELTKLKAQINVSKLPDDLRVKVEEMLTRLGSQFTKSQNIQEPSYLLVAPVVNCVLEFRSLRDFRRGSELLRLFPAIRGLTSKEVPNPAYASVGEGQTPKVNSCIMYL